MRGTNRTATCPTTAARPATSTKVRRTTRFAGCPCPFKPFRQLLGTGMTGRQSGTGRRESGRGVKHEAANDRNVSCPSCQLTACYHSGTTERKGACVAKTRKNIVHACIFFTISERHSIMSTFFFWYMHRQCGKLPETSIATTADSCVTRDYHFIADQVVAMPN